LEETLRTRIAELEQQVEELARDHASARLHADSLHAASVGTTETQDTGAAMQLVLSELRKVVAYDSASIQQLRGGRLVIVGGVGFADLDVILGESFDVNNADTPNGEVIHRRRGMIVADTEQYRAFRRGLHVGAGIRSWMGVPLLFDDRLLGMISLDKAEADFYTPEHLRLAEAFASLAATAMAARD
jgi:GAF domain-containing protein